MAGRRLRYMRRGRQRRLSWTELCVRIHWLPFGSEDELRAQFEEYRSGLRRYLSLVGFSAVPILYEDKRICITTTS